MLWYLKEKRIKQGSLNLPFPESMHYGKRNPILVHSNSICSMRTILHLISHIEWHDSISVQYNTMI